MNIFKSVKNSISAVLANIVNNPGSYAPLVEASTQQDNEAEFVREIQLWLSEESEIYEEIKRERKACQEQGIGWGILRKTDLLTYNKGTLSELEIKCFAVYGLVLEYQDRVRNHPHELGTYMAARDEVTHYDSLIANEKNPKILAELQKALSYKISLEKGIKDHLAAGELIAEKTATEGYNHAYARSAAEQENLLHIIHKVKARTQTSSASRSCVTPFELLSPLIQAGIKYLGDSQIKEMIVSSLFAYSFTTVISNLGIFAITDNVTAPQLQAPAYSNNTGFSI